MISEMKIMHFKGRKEEIFEEAFKVAEIASFTPEEISEYEYSLKTYRDNINVIETAKKEGREEGEKNKGWKLLKIYLMF